MVFHKYCKLPQNFVQPYHSEYFRNEDSQLKCCGVNGPLDWKHKTAKGTLPESCCQKGVRACRYTTESVHQSGCYAELFQFFKDKMDPLRKLAIAYAVFQILGMVITPMSGFLLDKVGYMIVP